MKLIQKLSSEYEGLAPGAIHHWAWEVEKLVIDELSSQTQELADLVDDDETAIARSMLRSSLKVLWSCLHDVNEEQHASPENLTDLSIAEMEERSAAAIKQLPNIVASAESAARQLIVNAMHDLQEARLRLQLITKIVEAHSGPPVLPPPPNQSGRSSVGVID
jgi:hypothetical protein